MAAGSEVIGGRAKQGASDLWTAAVQFDGTTVTDIQNKRAKTVGDLQGASVAAAQQQAADYAQKTALAHDKGYIGDARRAEHENALERQKYLTPGSADENQLMAKPLQDALEAMFKDIADHVASLRRERVRLSLSDLAENGAKYGSNADMQGIYNAEQAREAQRLDAESHRQSLAGDLNGAQGTMNRADEIKRGIGTLKDSEKDLKGEFMGALDASRVLQEIRDKVTFKGN